MFSLLDKIKYYRSRQNLPDRNKSGYARGFVNGSSRNCTKSHYMDAKSDLRYYYDELKTAKTESDREDLWESISYCKGYLHGYDEKTKH